MLKDVPKGRKPGDNVVAVGRLKLQSGFAVAISSDSAPSTPAQAARYRLMRSRDPA
ncbi:hypothetical protein [Bradyrhizobium sp. 25ACV]